MKWLLRICNISSSTAFVTFFRITFVFFLTVSLFHRANQNRVSVANINWQTTRQFVPPSLDGLEFTETPVTCPGNYWLGKEEVMKF